MKRYSDTTVHMLHEDALTSVFRFIEDRASICTVSKQWCRILLAVSEAEVALNTDPLCAHWDVMFDHNAPIFSDIDSSLTLEVPTPYLDLHMCKRVIYRPCLYHACAAGNSLVISHVFNHDLCDHAHCLAIFGDHGGNNGNNRKHKTNHHICFILACARGSSRIIRQLDEVIFNCEPNDDRSETFIEGLKRACRAGNLPVVRYIMANIPVFYHGVVMEAASHAYDHIRVLWYIFTHVDKSVLTMDAFKTVARMMARCTSTNNIEWLKSKCLCNRQFHERLDSTFWIACVCEHTHTDKIPPKYIFGAALTAVQIGDLKLFKRLVTTYEHLIDDMDIFLSQASDTAVVKYIIDSGLLQNPQVSINLAIDFANAHLQTAMVSYLESMKC